MTEIVIVAAFAMLIALGAASFRISEWHQHEADYWNGIHRQWLFDPERTDARYMPVLVWKKAHPPTLREKLRGWRSPTERMGVPEPEVAGEGR